MLLSQQLKNAIYHRIESDPYPQVNDCDDPKKARTVVGYNDLEREVIINTGAIISYEMLDNPFNGYFFGSVRPKPKNSDIAMPGVVFSDCGYEFTFIGWNSDRSEYAYEGKDCSTGWDETETLDREDCILISKAGE